MLLLTNGVDTQLDRLAGQRRQDWSLWMMDQVRDADHIVVVASAAYKRRAEGRAEPDEGRGVQYEARLIRDAFYRDQAALDRFVPVVPRRMFTVAGAEPLIRLLTSSLPRWNPPLGPGGYRPWPHLVTVPDLWVPKTSVPCR